MTESNQAMSRNAGIDALRGLSILLVVMHHIGLRIPLRKTGLADYVPRRLLDAATHNGSEAVFIFFVISGFLIAMNAIRRWGDLGAVDARAFYARRFARIAPCLGALVAVLSVLDLAGVKDYVITRADQSLPRAVFSALALHLNWYEGHTGYLPGNWDVLWSLSIEEVFYLAFPIVFLALRRDRALLPMLAVLALSLPWDRPAAPASEVWQEKAYLPGMAAIAAGVMGAIVASRVRAPRRPWIAVLGIIGVLGIASVLFIEDMLWPVLGEGTMLVLTVSTVSLVLACAWSKPDLALPGTGWLRSMGRLSYEIYLTHMFVVFSCVRLYRAAGGNVATGFLWYAPIVVVCWAMGAVVERSFSKPCEDELRKKLLRAPGTAEDSPVPAA